MIPRARGWLFRAGVAALLAAGCGADPSNGAGRSGDGAGLPGPGPVTAVEGPRALCRSDADCATSERCCPAGLFGLCAPLDPGAECAAPDLTLALPPDFEPRVEQRFFGEDDCLLDKCVSGPGARRLLRFPLHVVNRGRGPAIIAQPNAPGVRRVACDDSLFLDAFLRYELIDAQGARRASGVGDAALACRVNALAAPTSPFDCQTLGLEASSYRELDDQADCQWVDITTLPAGQYTLRLSVNADSRLSEASFADNVVERAVDIPEADPLAPCDPDDVPEDVRAIESLECGWEPMPGQGGVACEPGERIELACTFCDGGYVPRACPGGEPCSAAGSQRIAAISMSSGACSLEESCEASSQCTAFDFDCPASGVFSLYGFPATPFLPVEPGARAVPRTVRCRPAGTAPFSRGAAPGDEPR